VTQSGAAYRTVFEAFDGHVVGELPLGDRVVLRASAGYAHRRVGVEPGVEPSGLPSVAYDLVEARIGARVVPVEPLELGAALGGGWVVALGELGSEAWFPAHRSYAVGGALSARLTLDLYSVSLRGRYDRFVHDFDPELGAARVAGGAADEIAELVLELGLALP
jgi:hypothetical protein